MARERRGDDAARISPTAHYTAYVWVRHGMSHEAFATARGRALFWGVQPINALYHKLSGKGSLIHLLLARHQILDALLTRWIEERGVSQVVEIAAGLSPRGFRFCQRYPKLRYIEADLPDMARHKRALLQRHDLRGEHHRVEPLNALHRDGELSLPAVAQRCLDPHQKTALLTEGLVSYLKPDDLRLMWQIFAQQLQSQPAGGVYLSNLIPDDASEISATARWFRTALQIFVRGSVHFHFPHDDAAKEALLNCGFTHATVHKPTAFPQFKAALTPGPLRILEASVCVP